MSDKNTRKHLDEYINIVEQSYSKTASAKSPSVNQSLMSKLAEELLKEEPVSGAAEGVEAAAATAGAKPAASNVAAGASPEVVAATEDAVKTQMALAGQNPAEAASGEIAAVVQPQEDVLVGSGSGKAKTSNELGKTPAAVAAAAEPTSKIDSVEKMSELKRAEEIGSTMARSFIVELEKVAEDREYRECLAYLQDRGLLEGYVIKN